MFRGGFTARAAVVVRLLDLEARGAKFTLQPGGHFRVDPVDVLTDDDIRFLRIYRDEARRVISYEAPEPRVCLE